MNDFLKRIVKFGAILSIATAILLLAAAALLIFAPKLFLSLLYYTAITVCLIGAVWLIVSLIRGLITEHRAVTR